MAYELLRTTKFKSSIRIRRGSMQSIHVVLPHVSSNSAWCVCLYAVSPCHTLVKCFSIYCRYLYQEMAFLFLTFLNCMYSNNLMFKAVSLGNGKVSCDYIWCWWSCRRGDYKKSDANVKRWWAGNERKKVWYVLWVYLLLGQSVHRIYYILFDPV